MCDNKHKAELSAPTLLTKKEYKTPMLVFHGKVWAITTGASNLERLESKRGKPSWRQKRPRP